MLSTFPIGFLRTRWPLAATFAFLALLVVAMLIATGGHPTYSLDDAWIHLQFSEQIANGHFGLVPGEKSSPSSSILYPLLLIPLAGTALHPWLPAAWNLAALVAVVLLWQRLFERFVLADIEPQQRKLAAGLSTLAMTLMNSMFWLVATGMEHALQVAAALAVAVGMIELLQQRQARWWLMAGLIAGPLLRLENFGITLPAICVLLWHGYWRIALLALLGSIGGVVAHGLISTAAGLPFLGGPILIKSLLGAWAQSPLQTLQAEIIGFARSIRAGRADSGNIVLMALLAIVLLWRWRRGGDPAASWLAAIGILSLLGQFVLGGSPWPGRYEIYSQCFGLAALVFGAREVLQSAVRRLGAASAAASGAVLLAALFPASLVWTAISPWAAQDIWRQQWQMRRFVLEHVKAPVAVNDVGLVAYRNPHMVLDLIGLGSEEVRLQRLAGRDDRDATAALLAKHKVEAIIVYDSWMQDRLPANVERVAEFQLGRFAVAAGGPAVAVYATSPENAAKLRRLAAEFAPSMPSGSHLLVLPSR